MSFKNVCLHCTLFLMLLNTGIAAAETPSMIDDSGNAASEPREPTTPPENVYATSDSVLVDSPVPIANQLTEQLGITTGQAEAGAGSIFRLAQQTMDDAQFTQLSLSVPGMQTLLTADPLGDGEDTQSGDDPATRPDPGISGRALLSNEFDQFGMAPGMVDSFIRVIAAHLRTSGDENSAVLLEQILAEP